MTTEVQDELKRLFNAANFQNPAAVSLTMKKRIGSLACDAIVASDTLRYFRRRLESAILGSAAKRHGRRLLMVAVLEVSRDARPHYHCTPITPPPPLNTPWLDRLHLEAASEAIAVRFHRLARSVFEWRRFNRALPTRANQDHSVKETQLVSTTRRQLQPATWLGQPGYRCPHQNRLDAVASKSNSLVAHQNNCAYSFLGIAMSLEHPKLLLDPVPDSNLAAVERSSRIIENRQGRSSPQIVIREKSW